MAKPTLVTVPFLLLLIDFWPLRRLTLNKLGPVGLFGQIGWKTALVEKLPFVVISLATTLLTYRIQKASGSLEMIVTSFGMRLGNSIVSFGRYVYKMFWPEPMAVLYPYPSGLSITWMVVATLALLIFSTVAFRSWRSRRYLMFGWLWYLSMLVPVIGLLQVGFQSHADRYTYLPLTGLFIILAWGAGDIVRADQRLRPGLVAVFVLACAGAAFDSSRQLLYWRFRVAFPPYCRSD
jgi:protein O-mannosyl-transferase